MEAKAQCWHAEQLQPSSRTNASGGVGSKQMGQAKALGGGGWGEMIGG